jgi:hypothetical protein
MTVDTEPVNSSAECPPWTLIVREENEMLWEKKLFKISNKLKRSISIRGGILRR